MMVPRAGQCGGHRGSVGLRVAGQNQEFFLSARVMRVIPHPGRTAAIPRNQDPIGPGARPPARQCLRSASVTIIPRRGSAEVMMKRGLFGPSPPGGPVVAKKAMSQAGKRAARPRTQYRSGPHAGHRLLRRATRAAVPASPTTLSTTDHVIIVNLDDSNAPVNPCGESSGRPRSERRSGGLPLASWKSTLHP